MNRTSDQASTSGFSIEVLLVVSGTVALAQATSSFAVPAMPKLVGHLGGGSVVVGLAVSLYSVSRMLTNIPFGILTEKIGRRRTLIGGAMFTAVAASLSGLSTSIPMLLALRLLTGVGAAATITAGYVAITDLSVPATRARSLGVLQGWQFFTGISGPALGGFLADIVGVRAPFYASGAGVALLGLYAMARMPETMDRNRSTDFDEAATPPLSSARQLFRNRNFVLVSLIGFTLFFTRFGATQTLVPVFAYDTFDWKPSQIGLLFSVAAILNGLLIYPSAYIADKRGRKVTMVPAGFVTIAGLVLMAFAGHPALFIVAYLVMVGGSSFGGSGPVAYLGDVVPATARGPATGVYRTVGDAAGVVGPLLTTFLAQQWSYTSGFLVTALIALISYVLFALFASERQSRATTGDHDAVVKVAPPEPATSQATPEAILE